MTWSIDPLTHPWRCALWLEYRTNEQYGPSPFHFGFHRQSEAQQRSWRGPALSSAGLSASRLQVLFYIFMFFLLSIWLNFLAETHRGFSGFADLQLDVVVRLRMIAIHCLSFDVLRGSCRCYNFTFRDSGRFFYVGSEILEDYYWLYYDFFLGFSAIVQVVSCNCLGCFKFWGCLYWSKAVTLLKFPALSTSFWRIPTLDKLFRIFLKRDFSTTLKI